MMKMKILKPLCVATVSSEQEQDTDSEEGHHMRACDPTVRRLPSQCLWPLLGLTIGELGKPQAGSWQLQGRREDLEACFTPSQFVERCCDIQKMY